MSISLRKKLLYAGGAVLAAALVFFVFFYQDFFAPSVYLREGGSAYFTVSSKEPYDSVEARLQRTFDLRRPSGFGTLAFLFRYSSHLRSGRYRIHQGMSNYQLVKMLRKGESEDVRVTLTLYRTLDEVLARFGDELEPSTQEIKDSLLSPTNLSAMGLTRETAVCLFIPNTYFFRWQSSPQEIVERMGREYREFWAGKRGEEAAQLKLTPEEVMALASIVEQETNHKAERKTVAGVYLNRLRLGMPLQADPTVKFALGDFSIKRVRKGHLEVESPYNTYRNTGLPPGPICTPSINAIDAVLHYEKHDYLFFCARGDNSGEHNFSKTFGDHLGNARDYQKTLNKRKIE